MNQINTKPNLIKLTFNFCTLNKNPSIKTPKMSSKFVVEFDSDSDNEEQQQKNINP
jgi:hypothetical protein